MIPTRKEMDEYFFSIYVHSDRNENRMGRPENESTTGLMNALSDTIAE